MENYDYHVKFSYYNYRHVLSMINKMYKLCLMKQIVIFTLCYITKYIIKASKNIDTRM